MTRPLDPEAPSETLGLGQALIATVAVLFIAGVIGAAAYLACAVAVWAWR